MLVSGALLVLSSSDLFTDQKLYTGKEDHSITLAEASQLTHNFQKQASADQVIAQYFGRDAVINILQQKGCVGMRIYNGMDENGNPHPVIVGVDGNGSDMTEGLLAERASACPPFCSQVNDLNSPMSNSEFSLNY